MDWKVKIRKMILTKFECSGMSNGGLKAPLRLLKLLQIILFELSTTFFLQKTC